MNIDRQKKFLQGAEKAADRMPLLQEDIDTNVAFVCKEYKNNQQKDRENAELWFLAGMLFCVEYYHSIDVGEMYEK